MNRRYEISLLLALALIQVISLADRQVLAVLLPQIKHDLALADWQLGILGGFAVAIFQVALGFPIARLADRANRVRIITIALGAWSVATALCGAVANFIQLLLARIAVGVGESGAGPAAGSIIGDIFAPERRSTAMGIYNAGAPIGTALGLLVGGWIAELYGWRMAFIALGVPGIVVALFLGFTLREPARPVATTQDAPAQTAALTEIVSLVFSRLTFLNLAAGASLSAFFSYGVALWIPSYLHRTFHLGLGEIGTWLAVMYVTSGFLSILTGGYVADKLARFDPRWRMWLSALGMFLALPFAALAFLAPTAGIAIVSLFGMMYFVNFWLGPTISTIVGLVGARMRAVTLMIFYLLLTLIGAGLGPFALGFLSDTLSARSGENALQHALLLSIAFKGWSGLHYIFAANTIERDLARAPA